MNMGARRGHADRNTTSKNSNSNTPRCREATGVKKLNNAHTTPSVWNKMCYIVEGESKRVPEICGGQFGHISFPGHQMHVNFCKKVPDKREGKSVRKGRASTPRTVNTQSEWGHVQPNPPQLSRGSLLAWFTRIKRTNCHTFKT